MSRERALRGQPRSDSSRSENGGVGYYSRSPTRFRTSAGYFPIGVWGAYDFTDANVAKDKESA